MSELTWTQRILDFPVRAAAVDDFLRELKAKGTGDLNAVLTTLNESGLCRQAVDYWVGNGWIVQAPDSPLVALTGPAFARELDLHDFCGEEELESFGEAAPPGPPNDAESASVDQADGAEGPGPAQGRGKLESAKGKHGDS